VAEAVFDTLWGLQVRSIVYSEETAFRLMELKAAQQRLRNEFGKEYNRLTFRAPGMKPDVRQKKIRALYERTQRDMNRLFEKAEFYAGN
jgi:Mg2+ and Co2+ transporter CorA